MVLSLARSRYTRALQFVFLATNALGLILGTIYNAQTPDLYPNNAHHRVGWIVTWVVSAQVLISAVGWLAGAFKGAVERTGNDSQAFMPVSTEIAHEEHCHLNGGQNDHYGFPNPYRLSDDSGQGTEPNTESLRSSTASSINGVDDIPLYSPQKEHEEDLDDLEAMPLSNPARQSALAVKVTKIVTSQIWKALDMAYRTIDRIILPFGFVAFASGIATFGRFFVGKPLLCHKYKYINRITELTLI